MRSSDQDIELLEAYIKGSLDKETHTELEKRLAAEPDLFDDYEDLKVLIQGIRAQTLNEKYKQLKMLEEGFDNTTTIKKNDSFLKMVFLVVIVIATLLAISKFLLKNDTSKDVSVAMNDDEFYRYVLHRTERSTVMDSDTQKTMAYNLFVIKDFKKAKPMLSALWQEKKDTLSYFYLGIVELSMGNKEKAQKILSSNALETYPVEDLLKLCE